MIALRVSGRGTYADYPCTTVEEAKQLATTAGWTWDQSVREFHTLLAINDYDARIVHEYDAETEQWYECEMWEGATPKVRR